MTSLGFWRLLPIRASDRSANPRIVWRLVILLGCIPSITANAEEIRIVSPNGFADTEGNSLFSPGVGIPVRAQFLHRASDFAALPEGGAPLVGFAVRLDESSTESVTLNYPGFQVRLSTTPAENLDMTFANNIGSDETLVLDGDTQVYQPLGGPPREFATIAFDHQFHYDPSAGNLLVDLVFPQGFTPAVSLDSQDVPTDTTVIAAVNDLTATEAVFASGNLPVRELIFIPEPASGLILLIGTGMFATLPRRPRYRRLTTCR